MTNIAVFCSGRGTNLQAIINAIKTGKLKGVNLALVISDNYRAFALKRAKAAGIKNIVVDPSRFKTKGEFERDIIQHLRKENVTLIVLAGFMRIIGPDLINTYKNKILNIHPALLPSFKGAYGIKDAFGYGAKVTGVTVHFVDEKTDHGPIIFQEAVPIKETDTLESLESRIHKTEHKLYYKAISLVASGKLKIINRNVRVIKK